MRHRIRAVVMAEVTSMNICVRGSRYGTHLQGRDEKTSSSCHPREGIDASSKMYSRRWETIYAHISSAQGRLRILAIGSTARSSSRPKIRCVFWYSGRDSGRGRLAARVRLASHRGSGNSIPHHAFQVFFLLRTVVVK